MSEQSQQYPKSKSPLTLLLLIGFLVICTLVMISNYFLRPGIELDLKNKVITHLYKHDVFNAMVKVEGRNVKLSGITSNELEAQKVGAAIQNISGVHQLENNLVILQVDDQKSNN